MEDDRSLVQSEMSIADDFLIQVAEHAEKRIDAVIKIKKIALKVTNPRDWTDQNGNPYLQASGSEKVANLFNISWRIDEPIYEEDPDGHYTYSYKGYFTLGSRTMEAEGSRSSRDKFFIQYAYPKDKERTEISISDRSNKRDVKMAALTNLFGNGISRILGIRNLTWDDLKEFAGITRDQVTSVQYKKGGEKAPVDMPREKGKEGEADKGDVISEPQMKRFWAIAKNTGAGDEQIKEWLYREYNFETSKDITKTKYDEVCEKVKKDLSGKPESRG